MTVALLASALLFAVPDARAGALYINGVRMDDTPEVRLERCTVRIDEAGNIHIDAPGYRPPAPTASAPGRGPVAVRLDPVHGAASDAARAVATASVASSPAAPPVASPPVGTVSPVSGPVRETPRAVPAGRWWLVTEDQQSTQQAVEIRINGARVRTLRSSGVQVLIDVGPWLRVGVNAIEFVPQAGAGAGSLAAWIGSGTPVNGTLRLDAPEVRYALGSGDAGGVQRFALTVR
ncbi:MAG: hypothetical protein RLZZ299_2859 [Pseudomonadota bacterium]|jgi:hypothetical protein